MTVVLASVFWIQTRTTQGTRSKINKWNYIRLKNFYTAKETENKKKRGEHIWIPSTDRGLVSKIHKEHI